MRIRTVAMFFSAMLILMSFGGAVTTTTRAHDPDRDNPDPCPEWVESHMEFSSRDEAVSHLDTLGFRQTWWFASYNWDDFTSPIKYKDHNYAWYRNQAILRQTPDGTWTYRTQGPEPNPDITTYPGSLFALLFEDVRNWIFNYTQWWHEEFCNEKQVPPSFDPTIEGFSFLNYVEESDKDAIRLKSVSVAAENSYTNGLIDSSMFRRLIVAWQVSNLYDDGLCLGMASTVAHYHHYPLEIPGSRATPSEVLREEALDEIIDRHVRYNTDPRTVRVGISGFLNLLSDQEQFDLIVNRLRIDHLAIVMLYDEFEWKSHAVLAYDYVESEGSKKLYVYDPNRGNMRVDIEVDENSRISYKGYGRMAYLGTDIPGGTVSESLWERIWRRIVHIVMFSPANLHTFDGGGNHTGLISPSAFETEIPGSYYIPESPIEEETVDILKANDDYTLRIIGTAWGDFDLSLEIFDDSSYTGVFYHDIPIAPGRMATLSIDKEHPDYTLRIGGRVYHPDEVIQEDIDAPRTPIADAGPDITVYEGEEVTLDGTASASLDGEIIGYEWSFDGHRLYGPTLSFTWYDNCVILVTLTITYVITYETEDDNGNTVTETYIGTSVDTMTVTVLNRNPTATIDAAYMYVDFTLRVAGEKWHNVYWDLYETDWPCDGCEWQKPGSMIEHLEVERYPGDPDKQSKTAYDVYIDMEKLYYFVATYNPYEDDNPISGQLWGANPVWIDLTFEDGSKERIHHTFNVQQSLVRDSEHWVHVEPWYIDLSPWFVGHEVTFEASTYDPGTDDVTFNWEWGDGTVDESFLFTYRSGNVTDPYPSPYDKDQGTYPVNIVRARFYHTYTYEGDFLVTLTVEDDDKGLNDDRLEIDAIHTQHIYPTK